MYFGIVRQTADARGVWGSKSLSGVNRQEAKNDARERERQKLLGRLAELQLEEFLPKQDRHGIWLSSVKSSTQRIVGFVFAAAEARSFKPAAVVLQEVADCQVSAKTIEQVTQEPATEREQNWPSETPPE